MAQINTFLLARHLRSDSTHHVLHYKGGRIVRSGRGIAFWFMPLAASVAEIPCDDRDLAFLFHAKTSDYQDVTTQGVISYRIADAEKVAARVDFSIDLARGVWRQNPLEQIGNLLTQLAQQFAWEYVAHSKLIEVLAQGMTQANARIRDGFASHAPLAQMGIEIVAVRITSVAPTADLVWFVREAWPSVATGTALTQARIPARAALEIVSEMDDGGVIFGDGIETDRLEFAWGRRVTVRAAATRLRLLVG